MFNTTQKSVRDRYRLLIDKHKKKMREKEGSSGTVDNETELESLLQNIKEEAETALEGHTLKEETLSEETFAISQFLAKFAKVCSREIFLIYKSRKFILARKKKKVLDSRK